MPIRPEQRALYPVDWRQISDRIRFERAKGVCECTGQCGSSHLDELWDWSDADEWRIVELILPLQAEQPTRCVAVHLKPHPVTDSKVVLTVAHLDHQPEHCDDDNLLALCQRCHLAYDRDHHRATRAATRARLLEERGQGTLVEP